MGLKKYLPLKIIHLILVGVSIVLCCITISNIGNDSTYTDIGLRTLTYLFEVFAAVAGICYLAYGYKKNAAVYYKTCMVLMAIASTLMAIRQMTIGLPINYSIENIVALVMIIILATGKDLGKNKSYLVLFILIVCRAYMLIEIFRVFDFASVNSFSITSYGLVDFFLATTAAFMVTGKYLDKSERGTN